MKTHIKILLLTTAFVGLSAGFAAPAPAETTVIQTTTTVTPEPLANANLIELSAFDVNKDGIVSVEEAGEKLFYIFDRDGNEVIDNIEFYQDSLMTIAPMEKETVTMVDHNADGTVEHMTVTTEKFLQATQLIRFAGDHDGLAPNEFLKTGFLETDDNNDKTIDLAEWKESYEYTLRPEAAEQERYNN